MSNIMIRKAIVHEFGDVSKITVVDAPISNPEKDHVQVKIIYAGFGTHYWRKELQANQ